MMHQGLRGATLVAGVVLVVAGLGFAFQWDWATGFWPWPDGRLSYIFVGAVAAASGAHLIWIASANEPAMFQAFALDALLVSTAGAIHLWRVDRDGLDLGGLPVAYAVSAVACAGLLAWSLRQPLRDRRRTPRLVRVSYIVFVVALLLVSAGLIAREPHIFPWPLKPETSVFFGWTLVASAAYYAWGAIRRDWGHAGPQLLAFLVYDLVLAVPFARHISAVADDHRLSLAIYLAAILYSAALGVYYLLIHRATRVWQPAAPELEPALRLRQP